MDIEPNLERFLRELRRNGSPQYHSFYTYVKRSLIQFKLDTAYQPEKIIKTVCHQIINTDESEGDDRDLLAYARRLSLKILHQLRQMNVDKPLVLSSLIDASNPQTFQHFSFDVEQETKILFLALATLSQRDRQLIFLRHLDGLSLSEIQQKMNSSVTEQTIETLDIEVQSDQALQNLRRAYRDLNI